VDSTESANSDEDAAWRDLIARFDAPVATEEPVPWPDRENAPPAEEPAAEEPGPLTVGTGSTTAGTAQPTVWRGPTGASDEDVPDELPPEGPSRPMDPMTKVAWLALFGGPAYLIVATTLGWTIPGVALFCAAAAFVGGVALLLFKLTDSGPPDGDDGAVV
jgi:hypothetical protein